MSKKVNILEKLQAELERLIQEKNRIEAKVRSVRREITDENRKARTHRLCNRGGALESYLPQPESISDEAVKAFLKKLFDLPAVKKLVAELAADPSSSEVASVPAVTEIAEAPADLFDGYEVEEPDEDE